MKTRSGSKRGVSQPRYGIEEAGTIAESTAHLVSYFPSSSSSSVTLVWLKLPRQTGNNNSEGASSSCFSGQAHPDRRDSMSVVQGAPPQTTRPPEADVWAKQASNEIIQPSGHKINNSRRHVHLLCVIADSLLSGDHISGIHSCSHLSVCQDLGT